jgi:hypothetical protein
MWKKSSFVFAAGAVFMIASCSGGGDPPTDTGDGTGHADTSGIDSEDLIAGEPNVDTSRLKQEVTKVATVILDGAKKLLGEGKSLVEDAAQLRNQSVLEFQDIVFAHGFVGTEEEGRYVLLGADGAVVQEAVGRGDRSSLTTYVGTTSQEIVVADQFRGNVQRNVIDLGSVSTVSDQISITQSGAVTDITDIGVTLQEDSAATVVQDVEVNMIHRGFTKDAADSHLWTLGDAQQPAQRCKTIQQDNTAAVLLDSYGDNMAQRQLVKVAPTGGRSPDAPAALERTYSGQLFIGRQGQ